MRKEIVLSTLKLRSGYGGLFTLTGALIPLVVFDDQYVHAQ